MLHCWKSRVAAQFMYVDRSPNDDYAHDFDEPKRLVTMASEIIKTICKIQDYKRIDSAQKVHTATIRVVTKTLRI